MNYEAELHQTLKFLDSDEALAMIATDPYWPKWHSPWWHMLLLWEMGDARRIPEKAMRAQVEALKRIPLKIFPIQPEDLPEGVDPYRGCPCHCQLGHVYLVLSDWGIDVDQELPWIRPWFLRYQMADGGFNCDNDAYLIEDEVPSSMVATIPLFESILLHTSRAWTPEERRFLDRGAHFLMDRRLILGSPTRHNATERESARKWPKLCFPRFYFYDVLRGLNALLKWSEKTGQPIPPDTIQDAVAAIALEFPDGKIRNQRLSYQGVRTLSQSVDGNWSRAAATLFPLLHNVSQVDEESPYLCRHWTEAREHLVRDPSLRHLLSN